MEINQKVVNDLLEYHPSTGLLYWKPRPLEYCKNSAYKKRADSTRAGKEAFTFTHKNGYKMGAIFNKSYRAHTIIWLLVYGEYPNEYIDHINGDRGDNRLSKGIV